ncbi:hypothetical protein D918_01744 [Trichuris suis]|nr:hypothetical protein D918_01744 [Trichuris suis]
MFIVEALWILATTATLTEESLLGTVGYECNEKAACSTANSECRFDRCFCKDGYSTHFAAAQVECLIFPALGQSCNVSTDSRRSTCTGNHVVCVNGTCACDTLYKEKNGACVLDEKVVCDFVEKGLLQSCTADGQCLTPFAECYHGKCACRDGFSHSDGMCVPKGKHMENLRKFWLSSIHTLTVEYYCAQGQEPLRTRDSIHYCTLYNDGRDTCPNGSYCVPLTKWQTSSLCKVTAKVRGKRNCKMTTHTASGSENTFKVFVAPFPTIPSRCKALVQLVALCGTSPTAVSCPPITSTATNTQLTNLFAAPIRAHNNTFTMTKDASAIDWDPARIAKLTFNAPADIADVSKMEVNSVCAWKGQSNFTENATRLLASTAMRPSTKLQRRRKLAAKQVRNAQKTLYAMWNLVFAVPECPLWECDNSTAYERKRERRKGNIGKICVVQATRGK